ncbi:hypothetical protein ACFYO0_15365 [Streptomyces sp. NPDC006365]|uniref:hypothetical protein n=1 Tax=Streptomyces sp. NPDC006365 TaxID=3364744 RepID=UPI0036811783
MAAGDLSPDEQWPLPPAWMWDCAECVRLYEAMKHVQAVIAGLHATEGYDVDWDFTDSVVGTQISLSRHLADAHPQELPEWDPACTTCAGHRQALARTDRAPETRAGTEMVAEEHRARHLFAPPRMVGLM